MANALIEHMLEGKGAEIHIAMDRERAIYCEGKIRATNLAKILSNRFGANALVQKETEISSNVNGPIKVFPVIISSTEGNCLVIRTKDMVSALGIEVILTDSKVHHRGLKIMPISNGRRRSGRRNHSTRK